MKDYFQISQNKYNPLLSDSKPIVVRICIDTKVPGLNFDDEMVGGFPNLLNSFAKKFSREYQCVGLVNFNEINFIFNDPEILKKKFKKLETQSLTSVFSQEIFYKLNNECNTSGNLIYAKINVFNIFDNKIKSYISHRQSQGFNNYLRYCTSRYLKFKDSYKKSSYELFELLKSIRPFSSYKLHYVKNGFICKEGYVIDFANLDKDVKIESKKSTNKSVQIIEDVELDDI